VEFVAPNVRRTIGFFEKGQDAVDLVNCLNGGQPVQTTEDPRGGKLGVIPGVSDADLTKQLLAEEAATTEKT
jgi:hypothetical protein